MPDSLLQSLSLVDTSGYVIIATILGFLTAGVVLTVAIRFRYARIAEDLERGRGPGAVFRSAVLNHIVHDTHEALRRGRGELDTQAIVERAFHADLRACLVGERFVRSSTGLMVILGLVGTFYGLTLAIGKLARLVSGDVGDASAITESLTIGLTQALTGMSVAFSTSLFGIFSAIVMTLLSVVANVADRRLQLMTQIEVYLDALQRRGQPGAASEHAGGAGPELVALLVAFEQSVERMQGSILHFEAALKTFSGTTRDFNEFNLHLKDNVQRMSLSFGDLSETLKAHAAAFRAHD